MTTRKPARRAVRPAATRNPAKARSASAPSAASKVSSRAPKPAAPRAASPAAPPPKPPPQLKLVRDVLEDMKAVDARVLDVRGLTDIADFMVVASGTSDRHVRSIAQRVVQQAKASGVRPFGVEGAGDGEWVLVDLPDVMVHVMLPRVREFYALEQLWEAPAPKPVAAVGAKPRRAPAARGAAPRKASGSGGARSGARRRPPRAG